MIYFPTLNAILNTISAVFLVLGYMQIKKHKIDSHKILMLLALISSSLFLTTYLIYHISVGSVPYPYNDWTRPVYFSILIPHVILAAVNLPFIIIMVWHAWRENFSSHQRLARWVWPVWLFVSLSGVVVYLMLYKF